MEIMGLIAVYSILIPLIIGTVFLKKLSDDSLIIWGVVLVGTIPQLLNPILGKGTTLNIAYNLYILSEFILIFFLFRKKFYKKIMIKIFYQTSLAYLILISILFIFNGIINRFLNEGICLNSIIYTSWILMMLLEQYTEASQIRFIPDTPFFWYILGIFLYALCTILIFSFWDFMQRGSHYISDIFKAIQQIFNINLYVMFSIGFIKDILYPKINIHISSKNVKIY